MLSLVVFAIFASVVELEQGILRDDPDYRAEGLAFGMASDSSSPMYWSHTSIEFECVTADLTFLATRARCGWQARRRC